MPCTSILADAGAGHSNLAEFSTEQTGSHGPKQHYSIRLLFKIKCSMLTPAHKSQKRDKHKLFSLISPEVCQSQILTQRMSPSLKTGVWWKRAENNIFVKNGCTNLTVKSFSERRIPWTADFAVDARNMGGIRNFVGQNSQLLDLNCKHYYTYWLKK